MARPNTWKKLLVDKETMIEECSIFQLPKSLCGNQRDFNKQVRKRLQDTHEPEIPTEMSKLGNSFVQISAFCRLVGTSSDEIGEGKLLEFVFTIWLALFKYGISTGVALHSLVAHVAELHQNMSGFNTVVPDAQMRGIRALQQPLQAIFNQYVDVYLQTLRMIESDKALPPVSDCPLFSDMQKVVEQESRQYQNTVDIVRDVQADMGTAQGHSDHPYKIEPEPFESGTYGKIHRAIHQKSGEALAVKRVGVGIGRSQITKPADVASEVEIMRKLTHHHITTLILTTETNDECLLFIRPLADCDLKSVLQTQSPPQYEIQQIREWTGCLASALQYAHSSGIKHKDVKPANILIAEDGTRVLLTDFGLATKFVPSGSDRTTGLPLAGTPRYWAPECDEDGQRGSAVDIFALGCVFAEILGLLNQEDNLFERDEWKSQRLRFRDRRTDIRDWLQALWRRNQDFIAKAARQMLEKVDDDRPTANKLANELKSASLGCVICRPSQSL